jgi:hypothetical protein
MLMRLSMIRQMWTAFGIMLGFVADLAFYHVPNKPHITGLNWRLMLASVGDRRDSKLIAL